jgi:hypothetical protein
MQQPQPYRRAPPSLLQRAQRAREEGAVKAKINRDGAMEIQKPLQPRERRVGLPPHPGVSRLVTWTAPGVVNRCSCPYMRALLGLPPLPGVWLVSGCHQNELAIIFWRKVLAPPYQWVLPLDLLDAVARDRRHLRNVRLLNPHPPDRTRRDEKGERCRAAHGLVCLVFLEGRDSVHFQK